MSDPTTTIPRRRRLARRMHAAIAPAVFVLLIAVFSGMLGVVIVRLIEAAS